MSERTVPETTESAAPTIVQRVTTLVERIMRLKPVRVLTRFTEGDALVRTFARLLVDEPALRSAEALVPDRFPIEEIAVVGVPSVTMKNKVKAMFENSGASPRVAVYPPWFHPVAEEE